MNASFSLALLTWLAVSAIAVALAPRVGALQAVAFAVLGGAVFGLTAARRVDGRRERRARAAEAAQEPPLGPSDEGQ